ncbi:RWD domain-containing protein 2A [Latimeria chalumnae]|uniref:RWD domain containing 2A n=1 Tax=Latimeria chalumnae TaxID=7897 RepID=H2ZWD4_LATCH|nr:PREDICTED: RWD domain-containing protein 2A [Latimeria chalumnae]XP_006009575.1 PREDICTED: RWD domain-containing protein 2A [Latimeria chalumnae]XP_006009576.1 PREDICTED: RWD domain-containing protein 2A [Latimeria chalumnae]|eukprot:XP_006009574.1 PREDICTED: RWD domain-containing protein 2A [Latimeria chalumnae]
MTEGIPENLELQLSEMEMLFSMFPNEGEIKLEDPTALLLVRRYLEGVREALPPRIEFYITVEMNEPKGRLDLCVCLPHTYPSAAPELFVRSNALDRQQQRRLNEDLVSHIRSLDRGELCISTAVQWLLDNAAPYMNTSALASEATLKFSEVRSTFHRMWIYSHHIYRQELRKKILDCAKRLNLTGFCLTGKPGVICVEGHKESCEEFWRDIRYPNWKHISCKHSEMLEIAGGVDEHRLFQTFEELMFEAHGDYGLRNDYHMDLGQFLEFLKQHKCEHVFQILFGVEGKSPK